MRVINLVAENIKRLVAVDITPEGYVVEITGQNGEGKTSVLDAVWWALGGERVIQTQPIREGEQRGLIKLDLGEFVVTRTFNTKAGGSFTTSVKVEHPDGSRLAKPQSVLDALVGSLSFDPLEFKRMDARKQFEELKRLTGLDFTEIEKANKTDYETRASHNRLAKEYRSILATMPVVVQVPQAVDEDAVVAQLRDAGATNADIERRRTNRTNAEMRIAEIEIEVTKLTEEKHGIQQRLVAAPALPALIDTNALVEELNRAKEANRLIAKAKERTDLVEKAERIEAQADTLTQAMQGREDQKRRTISETAMPVEGLGFGDGFVTLDDKPFDQASDAGQLRAAVAIAAAMNPRLRVIRVRDGSLLDETSFGMLADFAAERDFQVWIEVVDSDRPGAIVIEEGRVAGVVSGDGGSGDPSEVTLPQSGARAAPPGNGTAASATPAPTASRAPEGSTLLMPGQPLNGGDNEDDELEF